MRLLTILLTFTSLQAAAHSYGQVSLSVKDEPLEKVLVALKKQSGYEFFYNENMMRNAQPVTLTVKGLPLEQVLELCFSNQPRLGYVIISRTVVIKDKPLANPLPTEEALPPPPIEVKGRVVDENGQPVAGASVQVKGTTNGTSTDANGNFTLSNVDDKATLVITSVNIEPMEVKVNGRTSISISAKTAVKEEEIVVAYGTRTRTNNTGAVTVVKGEQIQNLPNRSFDKSLQGLVSGLQITQGTGQPGGGLANFVLRGIATGGDPNNGATVRNPLIVIDGVPVFQDPAQMVTSVVPFNNPLAQLNPSDIETITVLKDAAAVALYGSRASNGVILVATKKGKAGKTLISYRSHADFGYRPKGKTEVLNQQEYLELVYETYKNTDPSWTDAAIKADLLTKFPYRTVGNDTSFYPTANWKDALYKDAASTFSNELSISGGNDKSIFYLNLEYTRQKGIAIATDFNRKSMRFNYENKPTTWLKIGLNTTLSHSIQNYSYEGSSEYAALLVSPLNPIRDDQGNYINNYAWGFSPSYELGSPSYYYSNPLAAAELNINRNVSYRGLSRLFTEFKFLRNFSFTPSVGVDFMLTEAKQKLHPKLASSSGDMAPGIGYIAENDIRNANIITTNILRYNKSINKAHNIDVLAGHEAQILTTKSLSVKKNNLTQNPDLDHIAIGGTGGGQTRKQTLVSYFGQLNYGFREKYFISGSIRADGSSLFGENKRFGSHWSAGAGWVVSSEPFMNNAGPWLNYLKLRGSIGSAGNSAAILSTMQYDRLMLSNFLNGIAVLPDPGNSPGNRDIQWEKTLTWDAGVEARFWKERIAVTADIYNRKTSEVIGNINLPSGTGFDLLRDNIGDLKNSGIELSLSVDLVRTKDFRWNVNANWSKNSNKLVRSFFPLELMESSSILANGTGKNYNSFYLRQWAGVNQVDGRPQWIDSTGKPNSDYNAAKRDFVGKPQPDGFGAVTNTFSFRGFELSAMFYYQYGFQIYTTNDALINDGTDPFLNQSEDALNRWQKSGDNAVNPRRLLFGYDINGNSDNGTRTSTRYLADANFLRFSNLSLSYSFPREMLDALHLGMLRVYIQGYNLALWTRYKGQDPELTNSFGSAGNMYPLQRSYTLGLNLNF